MKKCARCGQDLRPAEAWHFTIQVIGPTARVNDDLIQREAICPECASLARFIFRSWNSLKALARRVPGLD